MLSERHIAYARDLAAGHDPEVDVITAAAAARGMPVSWQISPEVGRLFQVLCTAIGATRVLEFGTFAGVSALWLARGTSSTGTVVTVERDADYAQFARANLAHDERIEVVHGDCYDLRDTFTRRAATEGPYDVLFLDTDKARYPEYLTWCPTVLRPGALLLADNVLASDSWNGTLFDTAPTDPRIGAIRAFNDELAASPRFTAVTLPIRSGVAVATFLG